MAFGKMGARGGFGSQGVLGKAGTTTPPAALVLPGTPLAVYSTRKLSTYAVNKCVDVVDSTTAVTTIGFVGNLCDFATIAALPQPVVVSKVYDQSGNGLDAIQTTANQRPSIKSSVSQAVILDGLVNAAGTGNTVLKALVLPAGVAVNLNACSIYVAAAPKTSIWKNTFFSLVTGATVWASQYTTAEVTLDAGFTTEVSNGTRPYSTLAVPALNGTITGFIGSGTTGTIDVDGQASTFTVASQAMAGGLIGDLSGFFGFASSNNFYAFIVYASALSAPNQTAIKSALASTFSIPQSYTGQVIMDGDSITFGYGGTLNQSWTKTLAASFPQYKAFSFGIPSQTLATMLSKQSVRITPRFNGGLAKNILVAWAGTNDISAGATGAATYANLQSYTSAAKTAGFKVVWVTMLPRTDLTASPQTEWAAYNALIRGATLGTANTADAIADVQGDATMGPFAAAANNTLYCNTPTDFSVGVHPTDLGNSIIAPYIIAAVGSL